MKSKKIRLLSLVMTAAVISSLFTGCTEGEKTSKEASVTTASSTTQNVATDSATVYPIKTQETLKFWCEFDVGKLKYGNNFNEIPFGKELEKKTGVKIEYIHPANQASTQLSEQFNLLVASGNLPDIIEYRWFEYPGGASKAISSKVITPLNDQISKNAPNLKKILDSDKTLDKLVKSDGGQYYCFPLIRNPYAQVYGGPIIRQDWLEELGIQSPETIDEYYNVLKQFKEKKGASLGLILSYDKVRGPDLRDAFAGAYKTSFSYFIDDSGKVQYGPYTPQYKEVVSLFKKWYSEGLIDKEFAIQSGNWDSKILTGKSGVWLGNLGGSLRKFTDLLYKQDSNSKLTGAKYPVLNKGDKPFTGQYDIPFTGTGVAITTACKNPDLAAKWLDYAYSADGNLLYNFGVEGESYAMTNGKPKFIGLDDPDPAKVDKVLTDMAKYIKGNGAYRMDENYTEQIQFRKPYLKNAYTMWSDTDAQKHRFQNLSPLEEDAKEMSTISTDLDTYAYEMLIKFIMGVEPMENYDKYLNELKNIGADKAVAIYQKSLDKYNSK